MMRTPGSVLLASKLDTISLKSSMLTSTYRRLMISQDKEEIYSTLASYPQEYLEHILGGEALRSRFSQ